MQLFFQQIICIKTFLFSSRETTLPENKSFGEVVLNKPFQALLTFLTSAASTGGVGRKTEEASFFFSEIISIGFCDKNKGDF